MKKEIIHCSVVDYNSFHLNMLTGYLQKPEPHQNYYRSRMKMNQHCPFQLILSCFDVRRRMNNAGFLSWRPEPSYTWNPKQLQAKHSSHCENSSDSTAQKVKSM
jgi:hypothetical protein